MRYVSEDWKAVHQKQLVNETYVEVSVSLGDPDALADASSVDNGAMFYSNTAQVVSEVDKNVVPYGTLEKNLWLLDGSRRFLPEFDYEDTGYVGDAVSGDNGEFATPPMVSIVFRKVHDPIIPGVSITWGESYGEYAERFKVTAFNGLSVVAKKQIEGNSSVRSVIEMDVSGYDLITIEIQKWCLPGRRARVSEIFVGVDKLYTKSDITALEHEREVDPIGATTPVNKVSFKIDNSDNRYDPNNEEGLSKYLMARQEVRVRYGMKLDNGTIERIPAGLFYLSEWEAPQNGLEASFVARDLMEFLRRNYTKGLYRAEGISLYDLAQEVLIDADLPLGRDGNVKWIIDEGLKNVYTVAPLPLCSLAECLQYIAQAGCCVILSDRDGILRIEKVSGEISDYALTPTNMYSRPEISLQKPLMGVTTRVYNYFVDEKDKELFSGKITVSGEQTITVAYSSKAINAKATVTSGTLKSAVYYTSACYLTIVGSGDVTVKIVGDILKTSDTEYMLNVGGEGETQMVENPLITSTSVAAAVSDWVRNWLSHRKVVSLEGWRADPRLDATDIVSAENKFSTDVVRMTSVKYTFAGAFRGSGEGRVI